jgi:hypothetical protein
MAHLLKMSIVMFCVFVSHCVLESISINGTIFRAIFFCSFDRTCMQFSSVAPSHSVYPMFSSGVTRCSRCGAVVCGSAWSHHQQYSAGCRTAAAATLNWICMTECRRDDLPLPQHPLRSAISVTTTLSCPFSKSSMIPYHSLFSRIVPQDGFIKHCWNF